MYRCIRPPARVNDLHVTPATAVLGAGIASEPYNSEDAGFVVEAKRDFGVWLIFLGHTEANKGFGFRGLCSVSWEKSLGFRVNGSGLRITDAGCGV